MESQFQRYDVVGGHAGGELGGFTALTPHPWGQEGFPQEDGGGSKVTRQHKALKQQEEWRMCLLLGKPRRSRGENPAFQAAF